MTPFRLTLIRHGAAEGGHDCVFGQTDAALSRLGHEQLQARWGQLSAQPIGAMASSPLRRCSDFAFDAAAQLGLNLHLDACFAEQHLGTLDGKPKNRWSEAELAAWDAWQRDPQAHPLPEGESWDAFAQRVNTGLAQWCASFEAEHRVLIAHQGVIKAILLALFQLPPVQHSQFWLNHGGMVSLWCTPDWPTMLLEYSNTLPDAP